MDLLHKSLLFLHVCAGFTSLSLFFVPMIARKGGEVHTRVGWWYVYGMTVVLVTAFLLSVLLPFRGFPEEGLLFAFLSFITARPLYFGARVVRFKNGPIPAGMRRISLVFVGAGALLAPVLLLVGGGLAGGGLNPLMLVFGCLGLTAWPEWLGIYRDTSDRVDNWLFEHIRGLLISSIAAFTAFFAFGGQRLFRDLLTGNLMLIPWIAPTVLGFLAIKYYKRKYRVTTPR